MDAKLEAAILDVLEHADGGRAVDDAWLRARHPAHWREIRAFLAFEAHVADGSPDGARVGPYRLLRRLGRGGAGTVYLGRVEREHRGLDAGTAVAVKVIHADLAARPQFVERVLAEARAAAAYDHPNVIRTLDAGVDESAAGGAVAYVVTEYVEGQNLRGLLDELGPLGEPLVRHLAAEILRALVAIHAAGSSHGDLKPENVLIAPEDAIKVADVGTATPSVVSPSVASPDDRPADNGSRPFRGTLLYAAPERFAPSDVAADGRADLFSLGVMVEEFLAGAHPFTHPVPERRAVRPSAFLRAFAATLRADLPEDRFATAAEALAVLGAGEESSWWRERAANGHEDVAPAAWSGRGARGTGLHGREREMDRLRDALDAACAGTFRAALVTGEPGIGKTRLVEEIAEAARHRGVPVVWCAWGDDARGAGPLAAALRSVASAGKPSVIVADDLHAAADADLALVAHLADDLAASPVLLVGTSRPLRAEDATRALPRPAVVDLGPLAVEGVCSLLAEALGSDDLADRIGPEVHRRSDGNPLAVLETLDALRDADLLVRDESGAWSLRGRLETATGATSARAMLVRRLGALPRADRDLLETAACIGTRFDPALVAGALGRDPGRVLLRLARLERREHLVRAPGDGVAFEHHEVRDAVLETVPAARVRGVHAAIAAAIDAAAAAHGGPTHAEAAAIVRHALRGGDARRAAPHVGAVVEELFRIGHPTEATELADAALADPALPDAARAYVLEGRGHCRAFASKMRAAIADFEECARIAESCGQDFRARQARAWIAESLVSEGRLDEAERHARSLLAEAAAAKDRTTSATVHEVLGAIAGRRGRFAEAVDEMRRFVELRRGAGDEREGEAEYFLAAALNDAGDHTGALAAVEPSLLHLRRAGASGQIVVWALGAQALAFSRLFRRDEAVVALDAASRLARSTGNVRMEATMRSWQADTLRTLARPEEAAPLHRRALELAERTGEVAILQTCIHHHAMFLLGEGRTAEALPELGRSREFARRTGSRAGEMRALDGLALLHRRWDDRDAARACSAEADAIARLAGSDMMHGVAAGIRGRCGGPGGAPDPASLREAIRILRGMHYVDWAAVLVLELARVARAEGRRDEAVALAREARDVLAGCCNPTRILECDAQLAALGATDAAAVAERLTARWRHFDFFVRIEAAGAVARASGDEALLALARADVESAVAHAPPERASALRSRLERQLSGPLDSRG